MRFRKTAMADRYNACRNINHPFRDKVRAEPLAFHQLCKILLKLSQLQKPVKRNAGRIVWQFVQAGMLWISKKAGEKNSKNKGY